MFFFFENCGFVISAIFRVPTRSDWLNCDLARSPVWVFADDSLLLYKAEANEVLEIKKCLRVYGEAFGQVINFLKSSIIFGAKVQADWKQMAQSILRLMQCFHVQTG